MAELFFTGIVFTAAILFVYTLAFPTHQLSVVAKKLYHDFTTFCSVIFDEVKSLLKKGPK